MQNMGEGPPAQRTCAAADRTGHAMLHALYQQSLRYDADFFIEYFALDLIMEDGACRGVVALCLEDGSIHRFPPRPWCWRPAAMAAAISPRPRPIPAPATAAAWCCAPGLPLQDMRVRPVPPDRDLRRRRADHRGRARRGRLSDQLARASASWSATRPSAKDLASRDVVSRSMAIEIREGRGVGPHKDHIYLHLDHIDPEDPRRTAAGDHRIRQGLRGRRSDPPAAAGHADRPLQYGRHPDQFSRRGRDHEGRRSGQRRARPVTRSARRPASRSTAPTGSARTA